jgi:hypothetical protein
VHGGQRCRGKGFRPGSTGHCDSSVEAADGGDRHGASPQNYPHQKVDGRTVSLKDNSLAPANHLTEP